jgi:hypothetical protein
MARYAGLLSVGGIQLGDCALTRPILCPFCANPDAALLSGRISFAAKMSGEIMSDSEPLAAFICPNSHVFLVRERDVLDVGPSFKNSCRTHSHALRKEPVRWSR